MPTRGLTVTLFCIHRTLCDNLRRERDRAVSDLADALRNLDDMRKQKNDTLRELKEMKLVLFYFIYFFNHLSEIRWKKIINSTTRGNSSSL